MESYNLKCDLKYKEFDIQQVQQYYTIPITIEFTDNGEYFDITDYTVQVEMSRQGYFIIQSRDIKQVGNTVSFVTDPYFTQYTGNALLQVILKKGNIITGSWGINFNVLEGALNERDIPKRNLITAKEDLDRSIKQAQDWLRENPNIGNIDEKIRQVERKNSEQDGTINSNLQAIGTLQRQVRDNQSNISSNDSDISSLQSANRRLEESLSSKANNKQILLNSEIGDRDGRRTVVADLGNGLRHYSDYWMLQSNTVRQLTFPSEFQPQYVFGVSLTNFMPSGDWQTYTNIVPSIYRYTNRYIEVGNLERKPTFVIVSCFGVM